MCIEKRKVKPALVIALFEWRRHHPEQMTIFNVAEAFP
jgi:hypothetical protein